MYFRRESVFIAPSRHSDQINLPKITKTWNSKEMLSCLSRYHHMTLLNALDLILSTRILWSDGKSPLEKLQTERMHHKNRRH